MVVATHHDGLGFHQAFVAGCTEGDEQQRRVVRLSGEGRFAWGAFGSMEQVTAHQGQGDLEGDIDAAVGTKSLCLAIQRTWTQFFEFELPYLPQAPCLFVRQALRTTRPTYASPYTEGPAETPGRTLDAFCDLFNIPLGSDAARELAVGMVNLGRKKNRVKEVMFVTNVGFQVQGDVDVPYVDPIPIESIDLLRPRCHPHPGRRASKTSTMRCGATVA